MANQPYDWGQSLSHANAIRGVYNFLHANKGSAEFAFQFDNAVHVDSCLLGWKLGDVDDEKRFSISRSSKESVQRF